MTELLKWLSANPTAATVLLIAAGLIFISVIVIYITAFFQGREISFWPPKIGEKPKLVKLGASGKAKDSPEENKQVENMTVYSNIEKCVTDMQSDFQKAKNIRLFLHLGRRELGDSEVTYFGALAKDKTENGNQIKVLHASKDSPFLMTRAKARDVSVKKWIIDIQRLSSEIESLATIHHVRIEKRSHLEPFVWRIYIFDDVAYVSGFLYARDNELKTPVYRFVRQEHSLYNLFSKYFDYLWLKYDTSSTADPIEKWEEWV